MEEGAEAGLWVTGHHAELMAHVHHRLQWNLLEYSKELASKSPAGVASTAQARRGRETCPQDQDSPPLGEKREHIYEPFLTPTSYHHGNCHDMGGIHPPKFMFKFGALMPPNVTFSGDRVLTDVTVKVRSLGWVLIHNDCVLRKRTDRQT